jgi:predicted metal-binding transcription factor (methanogenesis marker protein 9)
MCAQFETRKVPGWEDCPVPVCHGGDPRALTFCCHPNYPLAFFGICRRNKMLEDLELSNERFMEIKDKFSERVGWNDPRVCFKSLAYCCLRRRGCPGERDNVLREMYGDDFYRAFEEYILRKRVLAVKILEQANGKAKPFLEKEVEEIRKMGRTDLLELLETI